MSDKKINIFIINGDAITDNQEVRDLAKDIEKAVDRYHLRTNAELPKMTVSDKLAIFIREHPKTWKDYSHRELAALLGCSHSSIGPAIKKIEEG